MYVRICVPLHLTCFLYQLGCQSKITLYFLYIYVYVEANYKEIITHYKFYFWCCPFALATHQACHSHFLYLCPLSSILFTTIQFIFDMSLHVFQSYLQTRHGSIHTLLCYDSNQSHSWDLRMQRCPEWTVGSDAEQTRQQETKKELSPLLKNKQCEFIDGDNNVVVTYVRFLESYSFMLATDPVSCRQACQHLIDLFPGAALWGPTQADRCPTQLHSWKQYEWKEKV